MTDPDLRNLRIEQRMYGGLGARTDAGRAMEEIIRRLREHEAAEAAFEALPWQDATELLRPREHLRRLAARLRMDERVREAA
jgi:hypothetical protein